MLVRLKRLKPSAMRSKRKRSPKRRLLETRRSTSKKPGPVKVLRPRLPSQPCDGETPGMEKAEPSLARQTLAGMKLTPEINGEVVPEPTEGRAWEAPRSRRVSWPVRTLEDG